VNQTIMATILGAALCNACSAPTEHEQLTSTAVGQALVEATDGRPTQTSAPAQRMSDAEAAKEQAIMISGPPATISAEEFEQRFSRVESCAQTRCPDIQQLIIGYLDGAATLPPAPRANNW
jgi:hypothetical protein